MGVVAALRWQGEAGAWSPRKSSDIQVARLSLGWEIMRIRSRIVSLVALLAAPALVACDKEESHETDADTEAGTDTEAATEGSDTEAATEGMSTGAPEVVCDEEHFEEARPCSEGIQFCAMDGAMYKWGVCVATPACMPGAIGGDACSSCDLDATGTPYWDNAGCGGESTPLVLSFDGTPVRYGSAGRRFDLGPECAATDWPMATTPWLALDRDRSGTIDGGHELFGSATRLRAGGVADNGFTALKELDSDGDGRLTAADPGFAALVVWSDGDGDRRSTGFELQPVGALGLVAIELGYASERRCDLRGNCEVERATFTYNDSLGRARAGEVVDVHLACQ